MDLFSLAANLTIDTSEYDRGLDNAEKKSSVFSDVLKANIVTKGIEVCVSGFKKLGDAATNAIKGAVDSFGQYEQLSGGVETLFKGASDAVMENASQAYKTAGLSANQYMETVTSFSAALLQSTGRGAQKDTEAMKAEQEEQLKATKRNLEDQYDAVKKHWDERIRTTKDSNKKASLQSQRDAELKALKRSQEDQLESIKAHNKKAIEAAENYNNKSKQTNKTRQRAAELADMAVIDMADNANKMGTSMESIQAAYQGFSKQNYTMLDNLKLGYGGTKTEMERLLKDAEKLTGKKFDISSYADIVEAIHAIQDSMGIAGTTAQEGTETIEGSLNTLKGAWENMLLTIGSGELNESMEGSVEALVKAVRNYLKNLVPVVKRSINGFAKFVGQLAPQIIKELPGVWKKVSAYIKHGIVPALAKTISSAFGGNSKDAMHIDRILTGMFEGAVNVVSGIGKTLADAWNNYIAPIGSDILKLFSDKIMPIIYKLIDAFKPIWDVVAPKIKGAFDAIKGFWDNTLYPTLYAILDYVSKTLIPDIKKWVEEEAVPAIENAFNAIKGFWDTTLKPALDTILTFTTETLIPNVKTAWEGLQTAVETVFTAIAGFWTSTLQPALVALYDYVYRDLIPTLIVWFEYYLGPAIEGVFKGIKEWWDTYGKDAFDSFLKVVQDIGGYVSGAFKTAIDFMINNFDTLLPIVTGLTTAFVAYKAAITISSIIDAVTKSTGLLTLAQQALNAVMNANPIVLVVSALAGLAAALVTAYNTNDEFKQKVDAAWQAVKTAFDTYVVPVGEWIRDTFIKAWDDLKTSIGNIIGFLQGDFSTNWQSIWTNLVDWVSTPFNSLGEIIKVPINAVIDLLNGMIRSVRDAVNTVIGFINNTLSISIPSISADMNPLSPNFGVHVDSNNPMWSWSANLPTISWADDVIQHLANGGVLKPGQRAIVGEYAPEYIQMRGNQAVVTPMGNGSWRFPGGQQQDSGPQTMNIILELDNQVFARAVYKYNKQETQRVGMSFSNARL